MRADAGAGRTDLTRLAHTGEVFTVEKLELWSEGPEAPTKVTGGWG